MHHIIKIDKTEQIILCYALDLDVNDLKDVNALYISMIEKSELTHDSSESFKGSWNTNMRFDFKKNIFFCSHI